MAQVDQPHTTAMRLIRSFQMSQAIHVAAELGVADLLKEGPRTSDDLALQTDTNPSTLYRLLRALAAIGFFEERADRTFALNTLGDTLRTDSPNSVHAWAVLIGQEYFWGSWGNLIKGIRSGANVFPQMHDGMDVWTYRAQLPELNEIFNKAMTSFSLAVAGGVVEAYDFSQFGLVVDVGGSRGALLAAILRSNPSVRGINFDQPHVVSDADLKASGVADRCELVGGDFFESVPAEGDAYVMKAIIHDWTDEESMRILKSVRAAVKPDSKLLLIELVVGAPNEGPQTKFMDLNMLVLPGGRERTEQEFAQLYEAAGFRLTQVIRVAPDGLCVIEGVPA
jgi:hypothetical protein